MRLVAMLPVANNSQRNTNEWDIMHDTMARSRVYLSFVIRFPISNIVNNRTWIMPMKLNKYTRKLIIFLPCVLLINNKSPFFFNFYPRECYTNKIKSMNDEIFPAKYPSIFFFKKSNFPHLTPIYP